MSTFKVKPQISYFWEQIFANVYPMYSMQVPKGTNDQSDNESLTI